MKFSRKFKRKKLLSHKKIFMKEFRRSMKEFKAKVVCSQCGRPPHEGEKIDNWGIKQESENLDLLCLDCYVPAGDTNNEI
jgi:hypothetical protein|tara:strand:+ start:5140 stop:5379 length:240 start_codon:yes stop_codon:yes gene_type:complete